jgi:hypothetical protein
VSTRAHFALRLTVAIDRSEGGQVLCPARALDSSRGQRPPENVPAIEVRSRGRGIESGWGYTGFAASGSREYDPFRVGGTSVAPSGGVAPGYSIDPLRGSDGAIFVKMSHYRVTGDQKLVRAKNSSIGLHFPLNRVDERSLPC